MKRDSSAAIFQKFIHKNVPMTKAMGLHVSRCNERRGVRLSLPLRPNRNHLQTAFGGVLVSAQAVACWAWMWQTLRNHEIDAEVVLKCQNAAFTRPVDDGFFVVAKPPPAAAVKRFLETIRRHNKARLQVTACVLHRGRIASQYVGEYVAIRA
jgi:thioesterase domain-containing protein